MNQGYRGCARACGILRQLRGRSGRSQAARLPVRVPRRLGRAGEAGQTLPLMALVIGLTLVSAVLVVDIGLL